MATEADIRRNSRKAGMALAAILFACAIGGFFGWPWGAAALGLMVLIRASALR